MEKIDIIKTLREYQLRKIVPSEDWKFAEGVGGWYHPDATFFHVKNYVPPSISEFIELCPYSIETGWIEQGDDFKCFFPLAHVITVKYLHKLIEVTRFLFKIKTGAKNCIYCPTIYLRPPGAGDDNRDLWRVWMDLTQVSMHKVFLRGGNHPIPRPMPYYKDAICVIKVFPGSLNNIEQKRALIGAMIFMMGWDYHDLSMATILNFANHEDPFLRDGSFLREIEMTTIETEKKLIEYQNDGSFENIQEVKAYVKRLKRMEQIRQKLINANLIKEDLTPCRSFEVEEIREYLLELNALKKCLYCGDHFHYRSNKKYCSPRCRRMGFYYKKKDCQEARQ